MSVAFSFTDCVALITGASSGLGAEFARQLAPRASGFVLAARSEGALQELATRLKQENPALNVMVCPCDLSTEAGRATLWATIDQQNVRPTLLINNAGLGDYGAFMKAEEARICQQIEVNITALTLLTHAFVKRVRATAEKPAAVLNVSSLASALPVPDLTVYAATKSYVSSFTEGLAIELADKHIRVTAVCPGPTPTNFGKVAQRENDIDIDRGGQDVLLVPPSFVVSTALQSLENGKTQVFPSFRVTFAALLFRILPRPLLRSILAFRHRRAQ